ncbi:MAG: hypothetical protein Q8K83_00780 [Methylotenera sp.]|nr:hypothetical protein [Methylotenera sp.]
MRTTLSKPIANSLIAFGLALNVSAANALDSKGSVMINGLGQRICSKMTAHVSEYPGASDVYAAYIDGFASAINVTVQGKANYLEGTDKESRYLFVLQHCENYPVDTIFQAINQLYVKETSKSIDELSKPSRPASSKLTGNAIKPTTNHTKPTVKAKKPVIKGKNPELNPKKSGLNTKKKVKK